jgi:predicted outer membrane repeat protein
MTKGQWGLGMGVWLGLVGTAGAAEIVVPPGNTGALIEAINRANAAPDVDTIILGGGVYAIPAELPSVNSGEIFIVGNGSILAATASGYPLIEVGGGSLRLEGLTVRDFRNDQAGGAVRVGGNGGLETKVATFQNNSASGDGGAINVAGGGVLNLVDSVFTGNSASGSGGAVSIRSSSVAFNVTLFVYRSRFAGNSSGIFGCALNLAGTGRSIISNSQFEATSGCQAIVEAPLSNTTLRGNTFLAPPPVDFIHATAPPFQLGNNLFGFGTSAPPASAALKAICSDFGSRAIVSLGGNLSADASCTLNQPGDLAGSNPTLGSRDGSGYFTLPAGNAAIERGTSTLATFEGKLLLPCGYRDGRGIGRPQDFDGDGVFRCDAGAYEVQAGPNLGAAVSGAYFDSARNGEGSFVENLGNGQALVATFSYGPTGGLAWFLGVGNIVGNSVVVDDLRLPSGGVFGAGFNPASVVRQRVGSASFVFPNCEAEARPGQWNFQASPEGAYEDLIARASRLSSVVTCSGNASATAGRSGSFYAPARDGEGIFVEFLPDGRVTLIWYTYDPQGRQFWTISSAATLAGNTVTATMVYPAQTTRFGSGFVPSQVQLATWGTVTLTYSGCNALTFAYNSSVPGFGSGQYNYSRLTSLAGTSCAG